MGDKGYESQSGGMSPTESEPLCRLTTALKLLFKETPLSSLLPQPRTLRGESGVLASFQHSSRTDR